jgi:RNA polymerase sigma factor (sigma-70 family)
MELIDHLSSKAKQDYELVEKARVKGDQQAYAKLMSRYRDSLFYTILKMVNNTEDAEDLTIETFSKAFKNLPQYSPQFAFSTWLFKIGSNHCIDFLRKKRIKAVSIHTAGSRNEDDERSEVQIKDRELDPVETLEKSERVNRLRTVVEQLKPRYRQMVEMRYYEELSYEEISERLDLPLGTVKAQLFRAKDLLLELLNHNPDGL